MPDFGELVWTSRERLGGTPCVTGTRVPVQYIVDVLDDCTDAEIHGFWPTVSIGQVRGIRQAIEGC